MQKVQNIKLAPRQKYPFGTISDIKLLRNLTNLTGVEAGLKDIEHLSCYCRDWQGVPEAYRWGDERTFVDVYRAV